MRAGKEEGLGLDWMTETIIYSRVYARELQQIRKTLSVRAHKK